MASGKSTAGPEVAGALAYAFADLDALVEQQADQRIPVIFEKEGEAGFRRREARQLRATAEQEEVVIALGGGALTKKGNLRFVLEHGTVVYLHASAEEIVRRLKRSRTRRPLLQDEQGRPLSHTALQTRIQQMLTERLPSYRQAHITIDTSGQRVEETVKAVLTALQKHRADEPR